MAILHIIVCIQAETGSLTGNVCQLFNILKQKYNSNDKLLREKMIKKLNKIKPKQG